MVYYISLASDYKRLAAVSTADNGTGTGKSTTSPGNVYFADSSDSDLQKWVAYPISGDGGTGGNGGDGGSTSYTGILQRSMTCPTQTGTMYVDNIPDNVWTLEQNCLMHAGCGLPADFSTVQSTLEPQFDKFIQKVYPAGTVIAPINRYYYLYGEAKDSSGSEYHPGVDIIDPSSCAIKALYDGEVTYSGGTYGTVSVYVPQLGVTTNYVHLKNIAVSAGNTVQAGTVIGYQSNAGLTSGEHLHFEVRPARASGPESPVDSAANALTTLMPYGYMDGEL